MSGVRSSYSIDIAKLPVLTPSEADALRYMHISDCNVIVKVWRDSWDFCPVCGAVYDRGGYMHHRDKAQVIC